MVKQIITYQCGHTGEVELQNDDIQEKISYLRRNQVCPECFFKYKGYAECPIPKGERLASVQTEEIAITAGELDKSQKVDYHRKEYLNRLQMITAYYQRPAVDRSYNFEEETALEQYANISMKRGDMNRHGYSVLYHKGTKILHLPLRIPLPSHNKSITVVDKYCRYVIVDNKRYFVESDIFSVIGNDMQLSRILLDGELLSCEDIIELHDPLIGTDRSAIKVCSEKWLEYCVLRRVSLNMYHKKSSGWTEPLSYLYETILNKNISDCDIAEFENIFEQARSFPRKIYESERAINGHKKQLETQIKIKHSMIEEQRRLLTFEEPLSKLVEELIIKSGVIQNGDMSQLPFHRTNFEVKKFILEIENQELSDLFHKCMLISVTTRDGNRRNIYSASLFSNELPIDESHWEFEIPEPRLPYIHCASRGAVLHFNGIRNKLSQLIEKLYSLEAELVSLGN